MGKYDIGKKQSRLCQLTFIELCKELVNEYEDKYPNDENKWRNPETLWKLFKNDDESGLIDKLKRCLHFDIEAIAEKSNAEKFDELKLLKLLYYIEKSGEPKYKPLDNKDLKIQITDILAKPRLENIMTDYSEKSVYGSIFSEMFDKVRSEITDADVRDKKIEAINMHWEYITGKIFDYVISDRALDEPENAIRELERIDRFLNENVLGRLSTTYPSSISNKEGVMNTFYNILVCHKLMCNEADRLNINYRICIEEPPEDEYIKNFRKWEGCEVKWELFPIIQKRLDGEIEDSDADIVLYFISYGQLIEDSDLKNYKFAFKHFRTVLEWWIAKNEDIDVSNGVALDTLAVIIQEMVSVKKNKEGFRNDYYGYNNPNRSLSVAVTKPKEAEAVAVQAWKKKIENRVAVNFGAYDLIKKKRQVENTIYKIKQFVYSYQNLEDLEFSNDVLYHFVARSVVSRDLARFIGNRFADKIYSQLKGNARRVRFIMWPEAVNVYDMFREFTVDKYNIEDLVVADLAKQINEFYQEDSTVISRGMRCDFEVCTSKTDYRDFLLTFTVNRYNNQFEYQQFVEVCPDEDIDRMRNLGLEKFANNNYPMFF
ncbi:hypothetical protein [Clostridium kluyveri]|uniref:Uncharacterized protein n=1 Tax=Clostridium kluyveri TaxID=1534 RepID=A0A1L5FAF9_CLOKL|nr:hypothetical protein [Clostridium kluyveri]APM39953.1 hypothetical protein BS101_15040 [Clostridium kluyveri]